MAKKIVIVGALGYLGTELCKLYSGESWLHNIIAIDDNSLKSVGLSKQKILYIKNVANFFIDKSNKIDFSNLSKVLGGKILAYSILRTSFLISFI